LWLATLTEPQALRPRPASSPATHTRRIRLITCQAYQQWILVAEAMASGGYHPEAIECRLAQALPQVTCLLERSAGARCAWTPNHLCWPLVDTLSCVAREVLAHDRSGSRYRRQRRGASPGWHPMSQTLRAATLGRLQSSQRPVMRQQWLYEGLLKFALGPGCVVSAWEMAMSDSGRCGSIQQGSKGSAADCLCWRAG